MSSRRIAFWAALWLAVSGWNAGLRPVAAEEPYREFLEQLRERQYFDMAVLYLDQLATKPGVPDDIKALIPYEKAVTLLENSRITRSPDRQIEQLDQALAFLEQFVKESPNHPQAANANTERAQILIGKARVEIIQSKAPANQGAKAEYQVRARQLIGQARQVFDTALKQHTESWKKFGSFIDQATDKEKYAARGLAEVNMIRAMLDLALCTYEDAQTYELDSADYKRLLGEAANQFEEMHQRYRSQVGGLYARLWQGKCFEEMGDIQKAQGIYNELLSHPGTDGPLMRLKDQTLQFKLISLNTDARRDYQLVVDLGEEWLKNNRGQASTRTGLGVRWEVARAYEMLGDQRELPQTDKERNWRAAREAASQVNRFPGEYKDVSLAMIQRLSTKIGGRDRKPDTFDAAFGLGRQMINTIKSTKDQIEAARKSKQPPEEIKKLEQDLSLQMTEAIDTFDLALRLVTAQDDDKSVTMARYMYAYVNFLMRRNYEAAILGEYVAKTVDKEDETTGLDAAYLSMAAYVQAFNDAKGSSTDKDADLSFIIRSCNLLSDRWPESDRANDARMNLGKIYSDLKQPAEAAKWYNKVPETDPKFSEAQLAAGQAYWTAYLTAGRGKDEEKPSTEQLTAWRVEADTRLRNGIAKISATVPKEGAAPPELIAAKMSLAQIVISLGKDADAVKLLLDDPQSVIKAVTVADETKRPARGIQSRLFATETYKLLLRAYIGNGKLNEARQTMTTLEKIAGADAGSDVTELYVGLGKLLREELDRFREAGETERFNSLMTSFETFLNDLYSRQEGQTFGSLSWIGETYFALGEAADKDPSRSTESFKKAGNAFEQILKKAEAQPDFVPADQIPGVKVRLVRCSRLKKDFAQGEQYLGEVLKERPKDLRAQVEGAYLYQDWGATGDLDKLLVAINGNPELKLWGWRNMGVRLQQQLESGKAEYLATMLESRINGAKSRRLLGLGQTSTQKRAQELDKAEMELVATVTVMKDLTEEQFDEFNTLYHEILKDNGKPIVDLKATKESELPPPEPMEVAAEETVVKTTKKAKAKEAKAAPAGDGTLPMILMGVTVLAAAGGVGWLVMKGSKKTPVKGKAGVRESDAEGFGGVAMAPPEAAPAMAAPLTSAPAPKPRPRPAAASGPAAAKPAGTATAAAKPAGTANPAAPRPAPKPAPAAGAPAPAKPKPKPPAAT